ncbi:MAG: hypothetical protein KH828_10670 [Clostridiales bacterium]|nr:hypothetical protein [Clostridiales bacterium]
MFNKLKRYYQRKWRLSEKLAQKASEILYGCEERTIFLKWWAAFCWGVMGFLGLAVEIWESYYRKKRLMSILKCSEKVLAVDIGELLKKKSNTVYIGDDYTYHAVTDVKYLKNVRLIFGNADLRALEEMRFVKKLRVVMGDLFLSSAEGLEKLRYVGGTIYYKNQKFDCLKEFVTDQKRGK